MTPNRVNRAHWPTKENRQILRMFCMFPVHGENGLGWPQMGPGGFLFPLIPTLPTFWAERSWILRFFFLDSKFLDVQVPRFPGSQISRRRRRQTLRSQPDPSPNAPGPRNQICHKEPAATKIPRKLSSTHKFTSVATNQTSQICSGSSFQVF